MRRLKLRLLPRLRGSPLIGFTRWGRYSASLFLVRWELCIRSEVLRE